jgi:hypothetical protein
MMFGHNSDDNQSMQDNSSNQPQQAATSDLNMPMSDDLLTAGDPMSAATQPPTATTSSDQFLSSPSEPPVKDDPTATLSSTAGMNDVEDKDGLLALKQQALQELSPLVSHLDQTPEEKFRTTMMMIQTTDNQSLIKTAYEAAQAIGDPKAKAQALLDVVNEINYFTQHPTA